MEEPFPGKVAKRAVALGLLYLLQQVQKKVIWNANYVLGTWNAKCETRNVKRKLGTPKQMRGLALCIPQNETKWIKHGLDKLNLCLAVLCLKNIVNVWCQK